MIKHLRLVFCTLLIVGLTAPAVAQDNACKAKQYRQFDFWLGTWAVLSNGKPAGTNVIKKTLNGCVLEENYDTGTGYRGTSYSMYDFNTDLWHQTWVDNSGMLLVLDGGFDDGSMVLEGVTVDDKGDVYDNRISWTPQDDGTVRQLWQARKDDGEWTVIFDGLYRKK
ncbi:MAG: hypothetical protein AAF004_00990 [Pseudomonadota bacterium]